MRSILTFGAAALALSLAAPAFAQDQTQAPPAANATVSAVKPDSAGKQVATIKMGADSFTVDTDKLAVADGSATINATADELKAMLKK